MRLSCWTTLPDGRAVMFDADSVPLPFARPQAHDMRLVAADAGNFAACVNRAAEMADDGLLVTLPPDLLALDAQWRERLLHSAESNADGVFFYGDYFLRDAKGDKLQRVRADVGDITEREDWGPVWAVRVDWLREIALDERNPRAAFYDLLLKSWRLRVHVGGALAVVPAPTTDADAEATKGKLFFPGRGKLGGFSYLFMDPEDERQTEAVFYEFLRRQNAFIEGERIAVPASPRTCSPLVSVVTAVYNRARFVGAAIESVQRQTLTDWEYILVDNGSTDGTQDVIRSYSQRDSRVRLIENDRNIIALSLNLGVKAARGKYVAQLDSDDEYLPHTLEAMTRALEEHPTWGIAIAYYELMDESGRGLPEFGIIKHLEYNRNNILRVDGAGAPRVWHRSVISEFGGFDEKELGDYGEDYDLVLKCGERYEVGRVHEVCYRYRRHADNTDVLRDPEMKIANKTKSRLRAIERRRKIKT